MLQMPEGDVNWWPECYFVFSFVSSGVNIFAETACHNVVNCWGQLSSTSKFVDWHLNPFLLFYSLSLFFSSNAFHFQSHISFPSCWQRYLLRLTAAHSQARISGFFSINPTWRPRSTQGVARAEKKVVAGSIVTLIQDSSVVTPLLMWNRCSHHGQRKQVSFFGTSYLHTARFQRDIFAIKRGGSEFHKKFNAPGFTKWVSEVPFC